MKKLVAIVQIFALVAALQSITHANPTAPDSLVISELQTGSLASAFDEFVEVTNIGEEPIDVTGWKLEYRTATDGGPQDLALLGGTILPNDYVIFASVSVVAGEGIEKSPMTYTRGLPDSGGHIRILKPLEGGLYEEIDKLGWGSAASPETVAATSLTRSKSLKRCVTASKIRDSNDNSNDFLLGDILMGQSGPVCTDFVVEPEIPTEDDPLEEFTPNCMGITISEIFPNPDGVDTNKEYIELHNPTSEIISLYGCRLELASSQASFTFSETALLDPSAYIAFYDTETGIILPNASGGTVTLLQNNTEVSTVNYPQNLSDDSSWALLNTIWQKTELLTPEAANALPPEGELEEEVAALDTCPAGKERNPETNRCKNIDTASTQSSCLPGQERNPETNRCRNVVITNPALVSCKIGQERNPATNRCRSVTVASATLAACKEGQERNPETNRCRNVAEVLAQATNLQAQELEENVQTNTRLIILVGVATMAYGLFEYRNDIQLRYKLLRTKFAKSI